MESFPVLLDKEHILRDFLFYVFYVFDEKNFYSIIIDCFLVDSSEILIKCI